MLNILLIWGVIIRYIKNIIVLGGYFPEHEDIDIVFFISDASYITGKFKAPSKAVIVHRVP